MRTSFHHQPEAQHPKFFSYPQAAGRLPHLMTLNSHQPHTQHSRNVEKVSHWAEKPLWFYVQK